ncbi:enoyl-CoA hydratase/isomerase family protein [Ensifer canadensis]
MEMQAVAPEVIVERQGAIGRIRLNRTKALNSLNVPMIRLIADALTDFESDPSVAAVMVTGEGERGLCAGGDIRMIYESGRERPAEGAQFWREEFIVNSRISAYPKPYVAIMDGIVMGGGVGISAHGSHRIVTERTRLAMPETGIGYFPDVGATWLLHARARRIRHLSRAYRRATSAPLMQSMRGLADHYVPIRQRSTSYSRPLPRCRLQPRPRMSMPQFKGWPMRLRRSPLAAHLKAIDRVFRLRYGRGDPCRARGGKQ